MISNFFLYLYNFVKITLSKQQVMFEIEGQTEHYTFKQNLGQGSFGTVYRAEDSSNQSYAVKIMQVDPFMAQQAQMEIDIMKKLQHANLVRIVQSVYDDNDTMQIVMEFCEGGDLLHYYKKKNKKITTEQIFSILKDIVRAFIFMNLKGIFHRDLKPENILLTKENVVKIADFGCAKSVTENQISKINNFTAGKGTAIYSSPEILMNEPYSAKCDVWSAGCIVYFLHFGFHPFLDQSITYSLLKIQNMTKDKDIQFQREVDPTIQRFLRLSLKYQESQRATWRELSLSRLFRQKILDIEMYLTYLQHISHLAKWTVKQFWPLRKQYPISQKKSDFFAYFMIKFQYTVEDMAMKIIAKDPDYRYLFDERSWTKYRACSKKTSQIQQSYKASKDYFESIKSNYQKKAEIFEEISQKQPKRRLDCFNDLDNSIRGAFRILSEIQPNLSHLTQKLVGDDPNKVWMVMAQWINFQHWLDYQKQFQSGSQPRYQRIIAIDVNNTPQFLARQLERYNNGDCNL